MVSGQNREPAETRRGRHQGGLRRSRAEQRNLCQRPHRFYEHNLYPLRYNKAVADITKKTTGENIIWARRAWAGSQRYPIHWGGDAESTDQGMVAELRGGLSFGLSGFSFWSHDVGGFTATSVTNMDKNLFARWLAFGMLSSTAAATASRPRNRELRRRVHG